MNEYNELEDIYFGKVKVDNQAKLTKSKGLYEYVNLLNPPKQPSIHVNYRLLIELTKIFKENRIERVMKKLVDYGIIKNSEQEVEKLIENAGNFAEEFIQQEKILVDIDDSEKKALKELIDVLNAEKEPADIQNTIYQIAKSSNIQPKDFFKVLYRIILGTSRGPKIGPFISDIGRRQVAKILAEYA